MHKNTDLVRKKGGLSDRATSSFPSTVPEQVHPKD